MDLSSINNEQTLKAVSALKAYNDYTKNNHKTNDPKNTNNLLWDDFQPIYMNIAIVNNNETHIIKHIRIPLPYTPLANPRVCFFSKDSRKNVKKLLLSNNITSITEVISIKKLSTHFKTFELKRKLSNMYDIFLADRSIIHLLPNYLGKHFYGRKKLPIRIQLNSKTLKKDIQKAIQCTHVFFKKNARSCCIQIGRMDMSEHQLLHNIVHCVKVCVEHIPGGWKTIQSLHINSTNSISIPLYVKNVDDV